MFKANNKEARTTPMTIKMIEMIKNLFSLVKVSSKNLFLVILQKKLFKKLLPPFSSVSILDFEQVNVSWEA